MSVYPEEEEGERELAVGAVADLFLTSAICPATGSSHRLDVEEDGGLLSQEMGRGTSSSSKIARDSSDEMAVADGCRDLTAPGLSTVPPTG